MAKRWAEHTPDIKALPDHVKEAYLRGFLEALEKSAGDLEDLLGGEQGDDSVDPFGNAPSLIPTTNIHTYMKVMGELYHDPTLSPAERNILKAKLEARSPFPRAERSTLGTLLGAGMGASATKWISDYLLSSDAAKRNMSPAMRKWLGLGVIGAGGVLGGATGGRELSVHPWILDPRKSPEEEEYSPWDSSLA